MSKLVVVGVLIGALLTGAAPVGAQVHVPGGIGDPLTLAASGVMVPYITQGGVVTLLEVASPVADNPSLHMEFFNAACNRVPPSVGMPLTTNDIAFLNLPAQVPTVAGNNGLITISGVRDDGFTPKLLDNPVHARAYVFDAADGTSRVLEPIILDTAEWGLTSGIDLHTWSPLRTAATFFSPQQTAAVQTRLFLICPRANIQGADGAYYNPGGTADTNFPLFRVSENGAVNTTFPVNPHILRARVYDTNESFLRNLVPIPCSCFTRIDLVDPTFVPGGDIYTQQPGGTYTELEEVPGNPNGDNSSSAFTGYRAIFTVGSPLNNFFGRLSNGSRPSIQGAQQFGPGSAFDTR